MTPPGIARVATVLACVREASAGRMDRSKSAGGMRLLLGWLGGMAILETAAAALFLWSSAAAHPSARSFRDTVHLHAMLANLPVVLVMALASGTGGLRSRMRLLPSEPLQRAVLAAAAPMASALSAGLACAVLPVMVVSPLAASSPLLALASSAWYLALAFCTAVAVRGAAVLAVLATRAARSLGGEGSPRRSGAGSGLAALALGLLAAMYPQDKLGSGRASVLVFGRYRLDPAAFAEIIPSPMDEPLGALAVLAALAMLAAALSLPDPAGMASTARRGNRASRRVAPFSVPKERVLGEPFASMLALVSGPRPAAFAFAASVGFSILALVQGAAPAVPAAVAALAFLHPPASALGRLSAAPAFGARAKLLPARRNRAESAFLAAAALHGVARAIPPFIAALILA